MISKTKTQQTRNRRQHSQSEKESIKKNASIIFIGQIPNDLLLLEQVNDMHSYYFFFNIILLLVLANVVRQRKYINDIEFQKQEIKISLVIDKMCLCRKSQGIYKTFLELI